MTKFVVKRIYETASTSDGYRVLVDRLWPRGVSKEKAALDEWAKEVAPSPELRKWFGHSSDKFEEFSQLYLRELQQNEDIPDMVAGWREYPVVTLLYGARDPEVNHAAVLRDFLVK